MRQTTGPTNSHPALTPMRLVVPPREAVPVVASLASWGLLLAVAVPLTFWVLPEMVQVRRDLAAERQALAERQATEAARTQTHEAVQRRLVEREMDLLKAQRDNLRAAAELADRLKGN